MDKTALNQVWIESVPRCSVGQFQSLNPWPLISFCLVQNVLFYCFVQNHNSSNNWFLQIFPCKSVRSDDLMRRVLGNRVAHCVLFPALACRNKIWRTASGSLLFSMPTARETHSSTVTAITQRSIGDLISRLYFPHHFPSPFLFQKVPYQHGLSQHWPLISLVGVYSVVIRYRLMQGGWGGDRGRTRNSLPRQSPKVFMGLKGHRDPPWPKLGKEESNDTNMVEGLHYMLHKPNMRPCKM